MSYDHMDMDMEALGPTVKITDVRGLGASELI